MTILSLTGAIWRHPEVDNSRVQQLCGTGFDPVVARCALLRWGDRVDVGSPLKPPTFDDLHDPMLMHGMGAAVDRLRYAVQKRQKVRIITDYDVDGTTSSLILQAAMALTHPDMEVDYYIPDRLQEGYGFSVAAAQQAGQDGIDLVVTADIGVRDHAAVEAAREKGVDVLICDHHLPQGAQVPDRAIVLCPPQVDCSYPNPNLAACGVSLKVAQALLADHPKRSQILRSMLKLAAVGTVADMVPLVTRENRAIVSLGLQELNQGHHHAGLRALLDVSGLNAGDMSERDLGFRIGPRINAAGRVADAKLVVQLLRTRDPRQARKLADHLNQLNTERQRIQRRLVKAALQQVSRPPDPFVVVSGPEDEGWHRGVVGIVASRLKDELHRPAAVISIQGDRAVGSLRSISGVHAVNALNSAADLLLRFGGHPKAAGFTLAARDLERLRERLCAYVVEHTSEQDLVPTRRVDAVVSAADLGGRLYDGLASLGPFGMGNPRPHLLLPAVRFKDVTVRANGQLVRGIISGGPEGSLLEATWWGRANLVEVLATTPIDLLITLDKPGPWSRGRYQLRVSDARLASGPSSPT